jgi:hypothetical protein
MPSAYYHAIGTLRYHQSFRRRSLGSRRRLMWRPRMSIVRRYVTQHQRLNRFSYIFFKFLYKNSSEKLCSSRELHKNRLDDNHTLFKGVKEFILICSLFLRDLHDIRCRISSYNAGCVSVISVRFGTLHERNLK